MDAETRLDLIRAKARLRQPAIGRGERRDRSHLPTGRPVILSNSRVGELRPERLNVHSEWLRKAEDKPVKQWQPKPRYEPHPLTKISSQLPGKLPKLHFD